MFADLDENGWIDPAAGGGEVMQVDHYYPFGMRLSGASTLATPAEPNAYLYNGKEYQDELGLGWHDYGARMYDGATGRWNGVDALAEAYQPWTTYGYVFNNPIRLIDPDGMSVFDPMGGDSPIHREFQLNRGRKEGLFDWAPESYFKDIGQGGPGDGQKKDADGNLGHSDDRALDEVVITSDNVDSSPEANSLFYTYGPIMEPDGPIGATYHALVGPRTWYDPLSGLTYTVDVLGYIDEPILVKGGALPIGPGGALKGLRALKNIGTAGTGKKIRVIQGGVRDAVKLWRSITRNAKIVKEGPNIRSATFPDGSKWYFRLRDSNNLPSINPNKLWQKILDVRKIKSQ